MSEELIEGSNAVEAKLAEAGADQVRRYSFNEAPEAAPEPGTPAEEVSSERPRNELGQFTSQQTEPEEAPEEVVAETAAPATNPDVEAYLAKYGNDPEKALQAAVHAQKQLGKQSTEVGELRQLVDQLSQLNQNFSQTQNQQSQYVDPATMDWVDQQIMEGPDKANQVIEQARQSGNSLLFQRALDTWKQVDPYSAAVYTNELRNQQIYGQLQQQLQQTQQLPMDAQVNLALQNVKSRNPEFTSFDDALSTTLEKYPYQAAQLEAAAQSGDPAQLEGAIETLYALAQRDTFYTALRTGETPENSTTTADVAVPQTSETREAPPEPSGTDRFKEAFRQEAERQTAGIWTAH